MISYTAMKEVLHIAVAANERYMSGALVALAGVAVHAQPESRLYFHVFTEDVRRETMAHLTETLMRLHPSVAVEEHVCDERLLDGLPYWAGSRMASVRCYFPYILKDVDWCLYLDCDVLYLASLEEHFAFRDDGAYAVVVQEESAATRTREREWALRRCGVDIPDEEYFNSGVMLFNFAKCRHDRIPERIHGFFNVYPDVALPDQTAMNVIFHGCKRMAPPKFDRLQIFLMDEKLREGAVIHYVSGNPWLPKFGEVASYRFRLWHAFADKYIWGKVGVSYRVSFPKRILLGKFLCYWALKTPGLWRLFCFLLRVSGLKGAGAGWRQAQVGMDCTPIGIREVLR